MAQRIIQDVDLHGPSPQNRSVKLVEDPLRFRGRGHPYDTGPFAAIDPYGVDVTAGGEKVLDGLRGGHGIQISYDQATCIHRPPP